MPYLSLLIFLPILFGVCILLMGGISESKIQKISLIISILLLSGTALLCFKYASLSETWAYVERSPWFMISLGEIGKYNATYTLGVDGISLSLILLSSLALCIAIVYPYEVTHRRHTYLGLLFILWGSLVGCFASLDLLLFYVFFEILLLPMYFLIGIWGGDRREYAAVKFLIYTLVGSLAILVSFLTIYVSSVDVAFIGSETLRSMQKMGNIPYPSFVHTLDWFKLVKDDAFFPGSLLDASSSAIFWGLPFRNWAFILLIIGFFIKLPAFPFHTWLPDAHVEAPTPVSVILASVLLKIGAYGIYRFGFALFPDVAMHYAFVLSLLAVFSIWYGGLNALAMNDLKKMIAYSSISHMGFFLLGMVSFNRVGVSGALFQLISHGLISAGLFLGVGFIYHQTHHRLISDYRGLAQNYPKMTFYNGIFCFAALGMPGFSGFIAEFLVLAGSFQSDYINISLSMIATLGIVLGAVYFLWSFQRMYFGTPWRMHSHSPLEDLTVFDMCLLTILVLSIVVLGVFPDILISFYANGLNHYFSLF